MTYDALVWRKSIFRKNGCCQKCGTKLLDMVTMQPIGNAILVDERMRAEQDVWCAGCYAKGKLNIVARLISDVPEESAEFAGENFEKVKKKLAKRAELAADETNNILTLKEQVRKLTFENSSLKGSVENIRLMRQKEVAERDKRIQALTKELHALEVRYDELARKVGMNG